MFKFRIKNKNILFPLAKTNVSFYYERNDDYFYEKRVLINNYMFIFNKKHGFLRKFPKEYYFFWKIKRK